MIVAKLRWCLLLLFIFAVSTSVSAINDINSVNSPQDGDKFYGGGYDRVDIPVEVSISADAGSELKMLQDNCSTCLIYESWEHGFDGSTVIEDEVDFGVAGDSRTVDYQFVLEDSDGNIQDQQSGSFEILPDSDSADFSLDSPSNGQTFEYTTSSVTHEGYVSAEVPGTVRLIRQDGSSSAILDTWSHPGSSSLNIDHTESVDEDTEYDWWLEYEGDDGTTATSSTYSYEVEREPEDADDVSFNLDNPDDDATFVGDGTSVTFEGSVQGDNSGTVYIILDGDEIYSQSHSSYSTTSIDHTESVDAGSHIWELEYEGDDGSTTDSSNRDFTVYTYAEDAELSSQSPGNGAEYYTGETVTYEASLSAEPGAVRLYRDGTVIETWDHPSPSSATYDYTDTHSGTGTHEFYFEYEGSDGSTTTTSPNTYTVVSDSEGVSFNLETPDNSQVFSAETGEVVFEASVLSDQPGTVSLVLQDGSSTQTLDTWNHHGDESLLIEYTESVNSGTSYDWYIEYEGSDGSTATSTTRSFEVEGAATDANIGLESPSTGREFGADATVDYKFTVSADTGTVSLFHENTLLESWSHSSSSSTSYGFTQESGFEPGENTWEVVYESDDGSTTSESSYFNVGSYSDAAEISLIEPHDNDRFSDFRNVTYVFEVDALSGIVELVENGSVAGSWGHSSGSSSYSFDSEIIEEGETEWFVRYIPDDDSEVVDSETRSFSVEFEEIETVVTDISGLNGSTVEGDPANIEYVFNVTANTGRLNLFRDDANIESRTHIEGSRQYVFSETVSPGSYEYYLEYIHEIDGERSVTEIGNFTVEAPPPSTGPSSPSPNDEEDVVATFSRDIYGAVPGELVEHRFTITNRYNGDVWVDVSRPPTSRQPECKYFELVEHNLQNESSSSNPFGTTGRYFVPDERLGQAGTAGIRFQVDMPDREFFEEQGIDSITCEFDTTADEGDTGDLVLEVELSDRFLPQLGRLAHLVYTERVNGDIRLSYCKDPAAELFEERVCEEYTVIELDPGAATVLSIGVFGIIGFGYRRLAR